MSHEGYKAYLRNQRVLHPHPPGTIAQGISDARQGGEVAVKPVPAIEDYRSVMVQRAVFQSIASMGLPAFTIHSVVRYSGKALKNAKNTKIRSWGPIGLGLAAVPFLPFIFDKPVEEATEYVFHRAFEAIGGPNAVGEKGQSGRVQELVDEAKRSSEKEKEL